MSLNAEQSRLRRRAESIQQFLGENEDVYSPVTPFANQVAFLTANNQKVIELSSGKGVNGKGVTKIQKQLKATIAMEAGTICGFVYNYALDTGDDELQNAIRYTASDLLRKRDADIISFVNYIVGVVRPIISNLTAGNYPVTVEDLDTLTTNANTFNTNLGKAARIDTRSSIASVMINEALADVQDNLNRLSMMLNYFKVDNPEFIIAYRAAAKVDKSGIRHSGIKGIITNNNTGQPVAGVAITLEGKKRTKSTTTDMYGAYDIEKFGFGKCKLTITAHGYESKTVDVRILRGKTTELNINLLAQVMELKTA